MSGVVVARAEAQSLIARVDGKASLLLAFDGVALAGVWTVASAADPGRVPVALAGLAGLLLVASVVVALVTVRPRLGDGRTGFPLWAGLSAAEVEGVLAVETDGAHVVALSQIVVAKMSAFRAAVDLTLAAVAVSLLAAAVEAAARLL